MRPRSTDIVRHRPDWRWTFLGVLARTGSVIESCLAVGKSRSVVYAHRARFPKFRAKWDDALEVAVDLLETEARRRAFDRKDPASAMLLMFLLKAHRPAKYRDNARPEPIGNDVDVTGLTDEQLQAIAQGRGPK